MTRALPTWSRLIAILVLGSAVLGCGAPLEARPAPGFVEVVRDTEQPGVSPYDFHAVAPEGVAFAARAVKMDEPPDLGFWENALKLRMQELGGYEFLSASDAKTADGRHGRELVFGHDEAGKAYVYRIRVFVERDRLLVLEAGGPKDLMQRFAGRVDWMFAETRLN